MRHGPGKGSDSPIGASLAFALLGLGRPETSGQTGLAGSGAGDGGVAMAGGVYAMTCANRWGGLLRRFYRDEAGLETVEWVVVTLLVAVAGWAVLIEVRDTLGEVMTVVLDRFLDFVD